MLSQDTAFFVHNISRPESFGRMVFQKFHIRTLTGEEADILGLRLIIGRKSLFFGNPAGIFLICTAQRENDMSQLILGEMVHHVRLVFPQVDALVHFILLPLRIVKNAGIMAGSKIRRIKGPAHFVIKKAKLHLEIAHHAWVRCHAPGIGINEIGKHELLIRLPHIHHLERDADELSHAAGSFDFLILPVKLVHGGAIHIIALVQKEPGRQGAVHAAGHGHHDFFLFCHFEILSREAPGFP